MKLIHDDKKSKVFLGDNFEVDLNAIFIKSKLRHKTAILITGVKSFIETDYYKQLKNVLKQNEIIVTKHIKVKPNPSESHIFRVLSKFNDNPDFILAVGGGRDGGPNQLSIFLQDGPFRFCHNTATWLNSLP